MADIHKNRIPGCGNSGFKCFEARAFLLCASMGKEPNVAAGKQWKWGGGKVRGKAQIM